jgi:hypothetical protein
VVPYVLCVPARKSLLVDFETDYIPVIGTIILIVDIIKQKGLLNSLRELNDKYELARKKGDNEIEQITATSSKCHGSL